PSLGPTVLIPCCTHGKYSFYLRNSKLHLPRPHLSVLPGHEVIAGADVMFRCSSTHPSTSCYLYLEGQIRAQLLSRERGDYNLSHVQNGDSGRYSCQCYTINASREWSAVSNTLDLVVRGETSSLNPTLRPGGTRKEDLGQESSSKRGPSRGLQLPSAVPRWQQHPQPHGTGCQGRHSLQLQPSPTLCPRGRGKEQAPRLALNRAQMINKSSPRLPNPSHIHPSAPTGHIWATDPLLHRLCISRRATAAPLSCWRTLLLELLDSQLRDWEQTLPNFRPFHTGAEHNVGN
uniref:Ig-like domain-containing protein n=1 Tax=Cyanistes caeruleus TaxID=156563 RepID=A0A8C0ZBA1_CYACU